MTMAGNSQVLRTISLLILICVISLPAQAADVNDSEITSAVEVSTYVFVPDQSTLIQTGGIAGVHWTYSIKGQFQLSVDPNAGIASFVHVDANATDDSPYRRVLDPNEVFNMTELAGIILADGSIRFEGTTDNGSDVIISLIFKDDSAHLIGETIPPAGSADFFVFNIEALAQRKYGGGIGTSDAPYQLATEEDLMLLGETPEDYDKHFILTADIDLDPNLPSRKVFDKAVIAPDTNDAKWGFQGIPFNGVFDGSGHTISHLTIIGRSCLGLFGQLGFGAEISNLDMEAVDVNGTHGHIGGLVGWNAYGSISATYSTGIVKGGGYVGGLVGRNLEDKGSITSSFWDIQTSGQPTSAGGTGKTTVEMQTASTFLDAGWDFVDETANGTEDIWWIDEGKDYPRLWWEKVEE